jgi:hypothetical protein
MSTVVIKSLLETALNGLSPALSTAWEDVDFTPVAGTPYQEVFVVFSKPDNSVLGGGYHQERGYMQVNLCYPRKVGSTTALARAELLRSTFKMGKSFSGSGITVVIESTPEIRQGKTVNGVYKCPVTINFFANIVGA